MLTAYRTRRISRAALLLAVVLGLVSGIAAAAERAFPKPAGLKPDVAFWKRIFTRVDTRHGLIHDDRYLDIVYAQIRLPEQDADRAIRRAKARYRAILEQLAAGKRKGLNAEQRRVYRLWKAKGRTRARDFRDAARHLRFQLGQSDKFKAGWVRAGRWRERIERTLMHHGVPKELAALPHVESSFNPAAYSRVGAAGLWQFTRSTGRRFLRVDHVVDERLDPYEATEAAARLLRYNYELLGSWPLAITAYNHGAAGVRRAVRELGTRDIETIVRKYKGRNFGFASRNFYVAFLAALEADREFERHFGPAQAERPERIVEVKLPAYAPVSELEKALGVTREALERLNPALRDTVWRGAKFVPKGYTLRLPCERRCEHPERLLARLSEAKLYDRQKPDRYHKVRRGQTLSHIAAAYGVSVRALMRANGLRNRNHVRVGQRLRLPLPAARPVKVALRTESTAAAPDRTERAVVRGERRRPETYRVRRGDTLSGIAKRLGIDQKALMAWNGITHADRIVAGQLLRISAPDGQPAATEPDTGQTTQISAAADAEALGPGLPEEVHPQLSADPSDYSVGRDGTIEVQAAETLGHYALWLDTTTRKLRRINGLRPGQALHVGHRVKLDFSKVPPETFERRRKAYHEQLQAEFFERYRISGTRVHKVRPGESLWVLAQRVYHVPMWLFRQYNPDVTDEAVKPGQTLRFPVLEPRSGSGAGTATAAAGGLDDA